MADDLEQSELDRVYEYLAVATVNKSRLEQDNKALRDALSGLYGLCNLIYVGADPADEIRRILATNRRSIEAARVLGCKRMDEQ